MRERERERENENKTNGARVVSSWDEARKEKEEWQRKEKRRKEAQQKDWPFSCMWCGMHVVIYPLSFDLFLPFPFLLFSSFSFWLLVRVLDSKSKNKQNHSPHPP